MDYNYSTLKSHMIYDLNEFGYYDGKYTPKYFKEILNTETVWLDNVNMDFISFVGNNNYGYRESKTLEKHYKMYAIKIMKFIKNKYNRNINVYIRDHFYSLNK